MTQNEWLQFYNELKQEEWVKKMVYDTRLSERKSLLSPQYNDWFKAFEIEDITKVHTVIVGNSVCPYPMSSDGYAFSSLGEPDEEILLLHEKIDKDLGVSCQYMDYSKQRWVDQGIMLLPLQTVRYAGIDDVRFKVDWRNFTNAILMELITDIQPRAFLFLYTIPFYIPKLLLDDNPQNLYLKYNLTNRVNNKLAIFTIINKFVYTHYHKRIDWS